jgi:hypothetical protein
VPPQDPWAGLEHGGGLASVPTDPIPQHEPQQYPTGGEVWSQATVQHSGQVGPGQFGPGQFGPGQFGPGQFGSGQFGSGQLGPAVPERPRNRAGLLAIIFLAVLVLGGGGGYAAFYFVKKHGDSTTASTPPPDWQRANVGDCMVNSGTEASPKMGLAACTATNSFKVVKVVRGTAVPRDSAGVVNPKTASAALCAGLKYDNYYAYWDTEEPAQNVVLCLALNTNTASPATGS